MEYEDYLSMPIKVKIAKFAEKAEKAIVKNYKESFGLGNHEIPVYTNSEGENASNAFLTIQGVWKFHDEWWGGRSYDYDLAIKAKEIFDNFVKLLDDDKVERTMCCALHAFMKWVLDLSTWNEDESWNEEDTKELQKLLNNSLG